jgi:hypothetical protein
MAQAEYNTPANQAARLKAAGLNPALIYESEIGGTGTTAIGRGNRTTSAE